MKLERNGSQTMAVLFDLDDTLLDHRGAARDALHAWSGQYAEPTPDLEDRWVALETHYYARYQAAEITREEQRRARVREFFPDLRLTVDADADKVFTGYWEAYVRAWRPFPDAVPALRRALGAGLAVGILTNGLLADQRLKAVATGLADLEVPLLASSELGVAKPDGRAFLKACEALGHAPSATLMVGDNLTVDIQGAHAAGLGAVLVDRYDQHPEHRGARIRSLEELEFGP